jgi:hypothetical protein
MPRLLPKLPQPALATASGVQAASSKLAHSLGLNFKNEPLELENGVCKAADVQIAGGQPPAPMPSGGGKISRKTPSQNRNAAVGSVGTGTNALGATPGQKPGLSFGASGISNLGGLNLGGQGLKPGLGNAIGGTLVSFLFTSPPFAEMFWSSERLMVKPLELGSGGR